jgi:hypothetical protein
MRQHRLAQSGNQGNEIRAYRQRADYDDDVPGLTALMYRTLKLAEEIVLALGS